MRFLPSLLLLIILGGCLPQAPPAASPSATPATAAERSVLSGVLPGATTLAGEVEIAGDLLIPAGASLRILPGTTVYIRPAEGTKIDPEYLSPLTEILVRGSLQVAGTAAQPVRFVRLGAAGEPWWAGIILDGATASSIEGAQIAGADTGIHCLRSSPLLRGNDLRGCRYGVIAQEGSSPRLLANTIAGGEGGVFCWRGSHPQLEENTIAEQAEEGVFADADSRPQFGRNRIAGCAIGVVLYSRDLDLSALAFAGNGEDIRRLGVSPEKR